MTTWGGVSVGGSNGDVEHADRAAEERRCGCWGGGIGGEGGGRREGMRGCEGGREVHQLARGAASAESAPHSNRQGCNKAQHKPPQNNPLRAAESAHALKELSL